MFSGAVADSSGAVRLKNGKLIGNWRHSREGEYSIFSFSQKIIDEYVRPMLEIPLGVATYAVRGCKCGKFRFVTDGSAVQFAVPHIEAAAKYKDAITAYCHLRARWFLVQTSTTILNEINRRAIIRDIYCRYLKCVRNDWLWHIYRNYTWRFPYNIEYLLIPNPRYKRVTIPYGTTAGDYMCELVLNDRELDWYLNYICEKELARHVPDGYTLIAWERQINDCTEAKGESRILAYTRYKNHILLTIRKQDIEDVVPALQGYVLRTFSHYDAPDPTIYKQGERIVLPTGTTWIVGETAFEGEGLVQRVPDTAQKIINTLRASI